MVNIDRSNFLQTSSAKNLYRSGRCLHLATAIFSLKHYQPIIFVDNVNNPFSWTHAVNVVSGNKVLDIDGFHNVDTYRKLWVDSKNSGVISDINVIEKIFSHNCYRIVEEDLFVAEMILKKYGL